MGERRLHTNRKPRRQIDALMRTISPAPDIMDSLRRQNTPEGMVRVLTLMAPIMQKHGSLGRTLASVN